MSQPPLHTSQLSAIIMAAGLSRRAAPRNKLLLPGRDGKPVICTVVSAICEAGVGEVIVVTGHQHAEIEAAVSGFPVRTVFAPDYACGMGHSLAAGVRAASRECRGFLICPGDLPGMSTELVRLIAREFVAQGCTKHIIPTHQGVRGHPVALAVGLRSRLETLSGDQGARIVLSSEDEKARTQLLPVECDAIHADNDQG